MCSSVIATEMLQSKHENQAYVRAGSAEAQTDVSDHHRNRGQAWQRWIVSFTSTYLPQSHVVTPTGNATSTSITLDFAVRLTSFCHVCTCGRFLPRAGLKSHAPNGTAHDFICFVLSIRLVSRRPVRPFNGVTASCHEKTILLWPPQKQTSLCCAVPLTTAIWHGQCLLKIPVLLPPSQDYGTGRYPDLCGAHVQRLRYLRT